MKGGDGNLETPPPGVAWWGVSESDVAARGRARDVAHACVLLAIATTMSATDVLSAYVAGTRAWFPHKKEGWVSATLGQPAVADGKVTLPFVIDETGEERVVQTTTSKIETLVRANKEGAALDAAATASGNLADGQLPPLRNPPLLEATDDLTNLSHLNEPSGASVPSLFLS